MNDINKILEELKQSLEKVDSARKQVDQTVESYKSLQKEIGNYSSTLGNIADSIDGILDSIATHKTDTIESLNKQLENIQKLSNTIETQVENSSDGLIKDFKEKLNKELSKLDDNNVDLESKVEKISQLKSDIVAKIDELSEFRKSVDANFEKQFKKTDLAIDKLVPILQNTTDTLSGLSTLEADLETNLETHKSDILKQQKIDVDHLTDRMSEIENQVLKATKFNRNLLIIIILLGFVVGAVMFFKILI